MRNEENSAAGYQPATLNKCCDWRLTGRWRALTFLYSEFRHSAGCCYGVLHLCGRGLRAEIKRRRRARWEARSWSWEANQRQSKQTHRNTASNYNEFAFCSFAFRSPRALLSRGTGNSLTPHSSSRIPIKCIILPSFSHSSPADITSFKSQAHFKSLSILCILSFWHPQGIVLLLTDAPLEIVQAVLFSDLKRTSR